MSKNNGDIYTREEESNLASAELSSVSAAEEVEARLRESLNNRISYLCRLAAFIIAVVTFATTILGHDNMRFVILGLSLSVALLAIAGLQGHMKPKR